MTASNVSSSRQKSMQGLYRPEFEHDACGVGMICDLKNRKSHTLIEDALQILVNLTHRGACGCDETTGDGAGIILQKPHDFLARAALETAKNFPVRRTMRPAWFFYHPTKDNREAAKSSLVSAAERKGSTFWGGAMYPWFRSRRRPRPSGHAGHPDGFRGQRRPVKPVGQNSNAGCIWHAQSGRTAGSRRLSHGRPVFTSPACRHGPWSTRACCWPTR
jgi:hypothetical protein